MSRTLETDVIDMPEKVMPDSSRGAGNEREESESKEPKPKATRWVLLALSVFALAGASLWWLHAQNYESTDDAQIEGHLDLVSTRISGTVAWIDPRVENNLLVEAGTLLVELDPRDYAAELEHAKADLDTRRAEARSAQVTVPIVDASAFGQLHSAIAAKEQALASVESEQANLLASQHKLQQDEAIHDRAERDRVRYQSLVEKHEISRSDYGGRQTDAVAADQAVEADRAAVTSIEQRIAQARSLVVQREAQIESARIAPQQVTDARAKSDSATGHLEQSRADLNTAQLNPSYTKLYAPVSGVIGRKQSNWDIVFSRVKACSRSCPWMTSGLRQTSKKRSSDTCAPVNLSPSGSTHSDEITRARWRTYRAPRVRCSVCSRPKTRPGTM